MVGVLFAFLKLGSEFSFMRRVNPITLSTSKTNIMQSTSLSFLFVTNNHIAFWNISGEDCKSSEHHGLVEGETDPSGWELALITDANNSSYYSTKNKMVCPLLLSIFIIFLKMFLVFSQLSSVMPKETKIYSLVSCTRIVSILLF